MSVGTWKIPNRDDPGDSDQYGTDDTELIMRLVAGVLSGTQPPIVQIKSAQGWEFWPGISPLWIRDSDGSHKLTLLTENMTTDANLTIPAISSATKLILDTIPNTLKENLTVEKVLKIKPQTTPGNDAANGQLFPDSADGNKLKYKFPDNTIVDLTAAAGAGAPTDAEYVTLATHASLSDERTLGDGDGVGFLDGGAGNAVTPYIDTISLAKKRITFIEDFFGDSAAPGNNANFQQSVGGTGAAFTNLGVAETGVFGAWQATTGSQATGRAALIAGNANSFSLGQGVAIIEGKLKVSTLSDASNEYRLMFGFGDNTSGFPIDGVFFLYYRPTSVNWQVETTSNTVFTANTTATVVGTGWVRLKVIVNAAGTSAAFYVNDVEVSGSPIAVNIPVGAGRELTAWFLLIKTVGTTARTCNIDYIALDVKLTTPR